MNLIRSWTPAAGGSSSTILACALLAAALPAGAQEVRESFASDPMVDGRFSQQTASTESSFSYDSTRESLTAVLDVDASPAFYLSQKFAPFTDAADASFSARFRVTDFRDADHPTAFLGLMTGQHVGDYGDGLVMVISLANGALVAHADIESFEQNFTGSAIPLELGAEYLAVGRYRASSGLFAVEIFNGTGFTNLAGFSSAVLPPKHALLVDRVGLQNGGARDFDSSLGSITVSVDDLFAPASNLRRVWIADATVTEGDTGTTNAVFEVNLSLPSSLPVTVDFTTADGSARAGLDYVVQSGTVTFPPGVTSASITVPIIGDLFSEGSEDFFVELSNAVDATISNGSAFGTIEDNDPRPLLTIADASMLEGDGGTRNLELVVSLSGPGGEPVTLDYTTANASATAGQDYVAQSGTLAFAPGETRKVILVGVIGDTILEGDESFVVHLSNVKGATSFKAQGIGTIYDDDAERRLSINDIEVNEGNSGTTAAVFAVTLTRPSTRQVTVDYTVASGTAIVGEDLLASSGTLTLPPGVTQTNITVHVNGDSAPELDETFTVNLSNPVNATIAKANGLGTIRDNDPFPELSIEDASVVEGNSGTTSAAVPVRLSFALDRAVTVEFSTADGTASSPGDYLAQSGVVTFPAGTTVQNISIQVTGDVLDEPNETLSVSLTRPTWASIRQGRATVTIFDDEPAPSVSVGDIEVIEGDGGTSNAVFTLTLSTASGRAASVSYSTGDGAASAGSDYSAKFGTATFPSGSTSVQVSVAVHGDTQFEPDEHFVLRLGSAINASLLTQEARCTIRNDDSLPTISVSDGTVTETAGGTVLEIEMTLSKPSLEADVTVDYATANGTATDGMDYEQASGVITFLPGETRMTIQVSILDDLISEADETFFINFTKPVNGELLSNQAQAIIRDNDILPRIFLRDAQVLEGDAGVSELVFALELDKASGSLVTATFVTRDGTAIAASGDYTAASGQVRFDPGRTNGTVAIAIQGDLGIEADETLVIDLGQLVNAAEGRVHAIGTILDDDARRLSISDAVVTEGAPDTSTNGILRITLNKPATETVTVRYATADGTATAGSDYIPAGATVTFAPGVTTHEVIVTVLGDDLFEADETVLVNLSNPVNAGVADAQGVLTIRNDDDALAIVPAGMTLEAEDCSPSNGVIDPGETVTVRFALRNIGTLPSAAVVARLVPGQGITPINAAQNYGVLAPESDPVSRTFTFKADGECGQSLTATLQIENGGVPYGNAAFSFRLGMDVDGIPVCCYSADIAVTGSGAPEAVTVNHDLTYSLVVTNRGPATATELMMTNTWRAPVTVRSAQSSQGTCVVLGETVVCNLGELEPGRAIAVEIIVAPDEVRPLIGVFYARATEHEPRILDNSAAIPTQVLPPSGVSISNTRVQEGTAGGGNALFTIHVSPTPRTAVTVDYATADGSARAGEDYVATGGTATIPVGASSTTVSVPILDDVGIEPDETFFVALANAVNGSLASEQATGTATIIDDDVPLLSVDDASAFEPASGSTTVLSFVARLSVAPQRQVTLDYATADGTARAPGDYSPASGRVTFAPGVAVAQIDITIVGDNLPEGEESFLLNLTNPVGARLERQQAKGTIIDDATLPDVSMTGAAVVEGHGRSTANAVFQLRLSRESARRVEVDYSTANGSALGGSDFVIGAGTVRFEPGETSANVMVIVNGDDAAEFDETFFVRLNNPRNARLEVSEAQGVIMNDDYLPSVLASGTQLRFENCYPPNRAVDPLETVTVEFGLVNRGLGPTTNLTAALRSNDHLTPLSNSQVYGAVATNGPAVFRSFTFSMDGTCGMTYTAELELRDGGRLVGVLPYEFRLGTLSNGQFTCCTSADLAVSVVSDPDPVALFSPLTYVITVANLGPSMATEVVLTNRFSAPVQLLSSSLGEWKCSFLDNELICGIGEIFPGETILVTNVIAPTELPSLISYVLVGGAQVDPNQADNRAVAANTVVPPEGISISDHTVVEGNNEHVAQVPVRLWPARAQAVTVSYRFSDGTAVAGQDYISTPGTISFAPGTTEANIPLVIKGDLMDEADETLTILLSNPIGAAVARGEGISTIADDDWPFLSITDAEFNVGTNTSVRALLTVSLSSASAEPVEVEYFTSNGTATAGTDYEPQRSRITFPPGSTALVIGIPLSGNTADEREEYFFVSLTNAVNATLPDGPALVTITDQAPTDLSISDANATEGNAGHSEAVFVVTLRNSLAQEVTVEFFTSDGTALAGLDYVKTQGTLRFGAGAVEHRIVVPVVGDLISEPTETFYLTLTNAVNGVIRSRLATGTILDNDGEPCISIADVTVSEGNSGIRDVVIPLRLSPASSAPVRVEAIWPGCRSTEAGQGTVPDQIVFAPGQTEASLVIPIVGDVVDEPDEICQVFLTNAVGASICRDQAQLIVNDDDPPPGLEISDVSLMEGNSSSTTANFSVTLAGLSSQTVTVQFSTGDGTATAGSDYAARSGVLTFPPGLTSTNISISVHGDTVVEPDERFTVTLAQPVNATLFKSVGVGTIRNDDSAPQTDCPAVVVVGTPGDQMCFEPFAPISLIATPDEAADRIVRMEFYSGSTLLGVDTSSPFEITWEGVPVGDYCVTAEAVCSGGRTVRSEPTCIGVTDRGAAIAIVRNFDDPEIGHLQEYLLEMGYCARVFDQAGLSFDALRSYWLVIWDDLGAPGLTSSTAQILGEVFDFGIPTYLIGDRLFSAAEGLTPDAQNAWSFLLHMTPLDRAAAPGLISFSTATEDRQPGSILSGRFAEVVDFTYTNTVDLGTLGLDSTRLATASGADLLVHYPSAEFTDFGQARSVTQGFRVTTGGAESLSARKALFQNAVCWLMRCSFCPLVYLTVGHSEVPNTVNVGDEFTFDVTVGNNGECIAFATTLTNRLPTGLALINAEFNQGTAVEYNAQDRTVVWRVGSVVSGTENNAILTLTVRALQPGVFKNTACAVANYELFSESNCSEFEIQIEGTEPLEPPALSFIRTGQGTFQLQLSGRQGGTYQIQTSSDLSNWLQLTNAHGPLFYLEVPEASLPGNEKRFYRAR